MNIVATCPELVGASLAGRRDWSDELRLAIRDPATLCRAVGLPEAWIPPAQQGAESFPVFAPWPFVRRMVHGNPHDPLLKQVLPVIDETTATHGFTSDPVGDQAALRGPGMLQKYAGRVLLITTGACAVHCRYCFRREYPYELAPKGLTQWQPALDLIAADPSIHEVILSGGDPLTLPDKTLQALLEALGQVAHVRRLRIHTRLPVMIPARVTAGLLAMLAEHHPKMVIVLHANHAAELAEDVAAAIDRLRQSGPLLLNQAVLLKGVNDQVTTLADLSERLHDLRIQPYYLHQLDQVQGASHFEVPITQGRQLLAELRARLPGYLVPRYVQEVAGEPNKVPL